MKRRYAISLAVVILIVTGIFAWDFFANRSATDTGSP